MIQTDPDVIMIKVLNGNCLQMISSAFSIEWFYFNVCSWQVLWLRSSVGGLQLQGLGADVLILS